MVVRIQYGVPFHLCILQEYKKVQFAENVFRTMQSQNYLKTDDSRIGCDYKVAGARGQDHILKAYATITRLLCTQRTPEARRELL